jgi:predicted enzyme related to lactoylglutathione lyase
MTTSLTVYVYSGDLEKLAAFYAGGLALQREAREGNWLPLSLARATFALHASHPDGGEDLQRVSYSFGVDDIEAAVARFRKHGAKVLRDVADEAFGRRATLEDPDGRVFELVQYG